MGNGQSAQPAGQPDGGNQQPSAQGPDGQSASSGAAGGNSGGWERQLSFKAVLGASVVALTVAFGAVGAGFSPPRVIVILCFALIFSATALPALRGTRMLWNRAADRRSALVTAACGVSAAVVVATFSYWPFGPASGTAGPQPGYAAQNSCDLTNLSAPPPVTAAIAAIPVMYAVRSTDSVAGDGTAVAHEIFGGGWMQQVFLATRNQIADASVVVSLNLPSFKPFPVRFEIITTGGNVVGSTTATYDGRTNNVELHARFAPPVPVRQGSLYALRVTNESASTNGSGLTIAIYAHALNKDPVLNAPYPVPVCAHGSGDRGANSVPILDTDGTYQLLSGSIWATPPP
jgi:hypothetical protein